MKKQLLYLLSAFSISFVSNAQTIDNTFGNGDGFIINNFTSGVDGALAVALQNNGKIVVAGTSNGKLILVRYNTDGSFDTSFGTNGNVVTHFLHSQGWTSLSIQTDNKIVVCAMDNYKPFVARYNTNGTLDTSFGTSGVQPIVILGRDNSSIPGMLIDSNGKIILFGKKPGNVSDPMALFLTRLNTDGSTDLSFGTNGDGLSLLPIIFNFENGTTTNSNPRDIAFNSQGEIIAQIDYTIIQNSVYLQDYGLLKYTASGIRDENFGAGGLAPANIYQQTQILPAKIKILPDGKIISTARKIVGAGRYVVLVKHNVDGSIDTDFGTDGLTETLTPTSLNSDIEILPSGKILIAGDDNNTFTTILYHSTGEIDEAYGVNGFFIYKFDPGSYDFGRDAVQQPDGKIIIVGATSHQCANTGFALMRLTVENPPTASINATDGGNNLQIFPNPTTGNITIHSPNGFSATNVLVFNAVGQEIMNYQFQSTNTIDLNLEEVENGMYSVQLIEKNGSTSIFKIIKQ